ncbi:MAG: metallophosphoesterase [Acidobacteria bacterium]|nr:metallophosphoesterase [Acidobacteriota bacterium]
MKPSVRTTIAQISDLHINRKTGTQVPGMLKQILAQVRPDILIVSGDLANQPVFWQMRKAARLLEELQAECKPARTIVIPGNHDFKLWGNVGLRRITRIPFEIYFRRDGLHKGFWWRTRESAKLLANALWWKGSAMREPVLVDFFEERPQAGLAIFAVNSNTLTEMMAAGKVESQDLQQLFREVSKAEGAADFPFRYKIALVHHHPAPIADAPTAALDRVQESFMVFYNAGLFLRELSRRGFNLVLHGHKHVAGFVRVGCEFPDLGRTVLPVAAAGTATHPAPDDSRGHHLHVIEIFDDDTATLKDWFFSASTVQTQSYTYDLDTLEDVRRRRCTIFQKRQKFVVSELRKTVQITADGYSTVQMEYRNCKVTDKDGLDHIPLLFRVERPTYLRGLTKARNSSAFVRVQLRKQDAHAGEGDYFLGKNWKPGDGPFNFGLEYRLMNGHVLTGQEFARHYEGQNIDSEYSSIAPDGACDLMTLSVQFPQDYPLDSLEFRCSAEYLPAPLQSAADERLSTGSGAKGHDDETSRIEGNLRREGNGYVLTCPQPVPGMIYKMLWRFPAPAAGGVSPDLEQEAKIASILQRLLALPATRPMINTLEFREWNRIFSLLDGLAQDINARIPGAPEKIDITVMVFDDTSKRLKFVCSNQGNLPQGEFFSGEGCAGLAFEKARIFLYHPDIDKLGYFIRPCESPSGTLTQEPTVLICFPWVYEQRVLGVINVSALGKTTKLLKLFSAAERDGHTVKVLQDLATLATNGVAGV